MHRLFSGFVRGWPAVGLLLLRVMVALAIVVRHPSTPSFEAAAALLLLVGLGTPLSAPTIALWELARLGALSHQAAWASALIATIAVALALVGPGAWSVDARLFGWRRIRIPAYRKTPGDSRSI